MDPHGPPPHLVQLEMYPSAGLFALKTRRKRGDRLPTVGALNGPPSYNLDAVRKPISLISNLSKVIGGRSTHADD